MKKVTTAISIDENVDKWLREYAKSKGMAKSTVINIALQDYINATKAFDSIGGYEEIAKVIAKHYGKKVEEEK